MERRFAVHAGPYRQALIAATLLVVAAPAAPASAAPKAKSAKKEFDKGVAAYQKSDYAAASTAFGKSFALENDAETLFAWAQAERKQSHCDKATELYGKLLAMDLPAENKAVIKGQIAECQAILDAQKPPEPKREPKPEPKPEPEPRPDATKVEPAKPDVTARPEPVVEPPRTESSRPWYRDPVGDALVVVGVVGLGVGGGLLVSAHSASTGISGAATYPEAKALRDQAESRGTLGSIAMIGGGVLAITGIVWYATHGSKASSPTVTGWLAPTGGGVAFTRGF